jgi:glycosyltransferase involved in cell wall biosynthesis
VISLGRGKPNGTWLYFKAFVQRTRGIPVLYAPFSHIHVLSEIISLCAPVKAILRFARHRNKAIVFYNRLPAYLPTLIISSLAGFKTILDLEDGEVEKPVKQNVRWIVNRATRNVFDWLCRDGALLSCRALAKNTRIRPVHCYYGTAIQTRKSIQVSKDQIGILLSGTLLPETGCQILIDAIHTIRHEPEPWAQQLCFEVCGMGRSLETFSALAASGGIPKVRVHGRKTDVDYQELLNQCKVGLALKPNHGPLAATTFPSKVIEFASAGLLVITTDISDVREVLGHGAMYLTKNDSRELIALLRHVVEKPVQAYTRAEVGLRNVLQRCSPDQAGHAMAEFIFGTRP